MSPQDTLVRGALRQIDAEHLLRRRHELAVGGEPAQIDHAAVGDFAQLDAAGPAARSRWASGRFEHRAQTFCRAPSLS